MKHNRIEDDETGDSIVLSDTQNKHVYNYKDGESSFLPERLIISI